MLNSLLMFGGKKHADLGIGEEFDFDSLHVPVPGVPGEVTVDSKTRAFALMRCPPRPKWSAGFKHRYSLSVWVCPHHFMNFAYSWFYAPYVMAFQESVDKIHLTDNSAFTIAQSTAVGGTFAADALFVIGHSDGNQNHKRTYTLKRLHWTHIFLTIDTREAVAEDRQKVWINGVLTAGSGASAGTVLQPASQDTQWPANPFLGRAFVGGAAGHIDINGPHQENMTMAVGSPNLFWNHQQRSLFAANFPQPSGSVAALYFIDDDNAKVTDIGMFDPITNIWTQKPILPRFGNSSFYLNFKDRTGAQAGANSNIAKDQLGMVETIAYDANQNISGSRNTFRGKAEAVIYPKVR